MSETDVVRVRGLRKVYGDRVVVDELGESGRKRHSVRRDLKISGHP